LDKTYHNTGAGNPNFIYVLLADDDADDRMIFEDAVKELQMNIVFQSVKNGQELMEFLFEEGIILPHIIFLDLNMPLKNGMKCLEEIRNTSAFSDIFITLYSTTARQSDIDEGYAKGSNLFIIKPSSFSVLKKILTEVFTLERGSYFPNPEREKFVFRQ
jgi:CheY-like chemotaxis protein